MPRKILVAMVGLVLVPLLGCGGGGGGAANDRIPPVVFGGGAATLTIEVTCSEPARVTAVFEGDELLETWQDVEAGTHSFNVDVPANVSGIAEVSIENPNVGAALDLVCRVDGEFIHRASDKLEAPLEAGYGFFAQIAFDDFAKGELSTD